MNKKTDNYDSPESNYFQIIRNNITPLDLFILSKINEGYSIEDVAKLSEKEFNIKDSEKNVKERFEKLISEDKPEKRIILKSKPQYIINPAKLYNIISLIFIKVNLNASQNKNLNIGIQNIFETIINMNNKPRFGKPIKQLFTTTGWMYDFVGIIYENNIERFQSFRNYLINEGIAKTVDIIPIDINNEFLFNPITSPDFKNFKNFLVHYNNRMNKMINEIKSNNIDSTKTMRFFDKYEFELHVVSGKNKGEVYPIDVNELKIGRYHDNDIIIQDITISRRHAKIIKIGNQYIFKDQSTNGSFINNKHIIYDEVELKNGDVIKIGKNKLQFQKV
jgi:hypothetical protein